MTDKLHEKASQAMMDNKNDLAEELYIKILEKNPIFSNPAFVVGLLARSVEDIHKILYCFSR